MKFMMLVKHVESSTPPPKPLMDAMEKIKIGRASCRERV